MADISYPVGCRPLTEDLGTDELIRRLKTLAHTLQAIDQEEELFQQYIPLALHLVDDFFLQHQSRDVQLLVACCIADILRIYAPEAPYRDQEQIRTVFMFFIKQLYGLKDPKDPSFKRYFYLLENLAYVKSFNMCFEIEDSQKIFYQLFSMMFKIINEEHSSKVKNFMLDILSPLVNEADNFTVELLDLILINVVEPNKSQNKHAYQLAEQLITKTSDALEHTIKLFFNQVLIMDTADRNLSITSKAYDLIYELNVICPTILCSVLPQLECKLKATLETERLKAVSLLTRMFSEKDSQLSKKHSALLRTVLGRFCDISTAIRVKCVQSSMHFLLNQPHLRNEIIECLRKRQHDSEESVRYEVVMAIVETAKRDFDIVCESLELLDFVRERTLDKKYRIRKESMNGLAFIYKKAICEPNNLPEEIKRSVDWIKNKILHVYYMPNVDDRLLVERLLITCLVPYKLPPEDRMKKLYLLLATMDENATKAFIELQKNQMKTRKNVSDWIKLHHAKDVTTKIQAQMNVKNNMICKLLPDSAKAAEYLTKFSFNMRKDSSLLNCMDIILKRDVSCKECADTMSTLLKKLGTPVMTNMYYHTIKLLIERIASVMVDKESIGLLVGLIENCIQKGNMASEVGIPAHDAGERGLKLLSVLSYVFSAHFFTDTTLRHMISLLSYEEDYVAPLLLKSLTHLGRYNSLAEANPVILEELAPICKDFALSGSIKQAKHAVRCIFVNSQPAAYSDASTTTTPPVVHTIFKEIIEALRSQLSLSCDNQRTKIVTLGHIAFNMPQPFQTPIKNMIARFIVKELLIQGVPETRDAVLPDGDWCAEEDLPMDTLCKLDAFKTMARWLLGLRTDGHAAHKTFRMLTAFINQRGDLLEENRLCAAEKSWLRLGAACAMLKVCEQNGVGDQYNADQYFNLSQLMLDPVPEVRELFVSKLHKGLGRGLPNKCLPLDFMGYYALGGYEKDKKTLAKLRHYVETDVNRRREYIKTIQGASNSQSLMILPDFMLAFAIPVLVHDPAFTNHEDLIQLRRIEECLRFILEPLMANREMFSFSFYKELIEMMKNHQDIAATADDNSNNLKMWAACDLAMYIIYSKIDICDSKLEQKFTTHFHLPTMYYKAHPDEDFQNTDIYIPIDVYSLTASQRSGARKHVTTNTVTARNAEKRNAEHILSNENSPKYAQDIFDHAKSDATEPTTKRTRPTALRTGKT